MSSELYIPILNGLQFVDEFPTQDTDIYATRHIDDFYYSDQIYQHQDKIPYLQVWVADDIIPLQFESSFNPINLDLYDQYGRIITGKSVVATLIRSNKYIPGTAIYEARLSLSGLGRGPYRYKATPGGNIAKRQKSEWFTILPNPLGTIRLDYFNDTYHEDVVFETGIKFSIRFKGYIEYMAPGNKIVTFEDQRLNQTIKSGKRFRNLTLYVGDGGGVPPWQIDKINSAFTCNNVSTDGKLLAFNDGKWNEEGDKGSPLKEYNTGLREVLTRPSKVVVGTGDPNKRIVLLNVVGGRLFGDIGQNTGENVIKILSQE